MKKLKSLKLSDLRSWLAILCVAAFAVSCGIAPVESAVTICINSPSEALTKAVQVNEGVINDMNVLVFNTDGLCVMNKWLEASQMSGHHDGCRIETKLYNSEFYDIYAFANLGYPIDCKKFEQLEQNRFYLAYPDEYSAGLPMRGSSIGIKADAQSMICVNLERMTAKVSLRLDRSQLDNDVTYSVKAVRVGATPKSMPIWGSGKVESAFDVFTNGYTLNDTDVFALNTGSDDLTPYVSVYLLENDHGVLLPGNNDITQKVLPEEHNEYGLCSYIEIFAYYESSSMTSNGGYLKYRFYIGEDPSSFDVCAGCHYRVTLTPSGNGIRGNTWRCDSSFLVEK